MRRQATAHAVIRGSRHVAGAIVFLSAIGRPMLPTAQSDAAKTVAAVKPTAGSAMSDHEPDVVRLFVGRSTVINAGGPITRVSLTSATIADALITGPGQLIVHGKLPGTISMFLWYRTGEIRTYEVTVLRDIAQLSDEVVRLFPGESISVEGNGKD